MVNWRKTYFFIHVQNSCILTWIKKYSVLLLFRRVGWIDGWRWNNIGLYFKMFELLLMVFLLMHLLIVWIKSFAYHWILRLYLLIMRFIRRGLRLIPLAESLIIDDSTLLIQSLLKMKSIVFQRSIAIIVLTLHKKVLVCIWIPGVGPLLVLRLSWSIRSLANVSEILIIIVFFFRNDFLLYYQAVSVSYSCLTHIGLMSKNYRLFLLSVEVGYLVQEVAWGETRKLPCFIFEAVWRFHSWTQLQHCLNLSPHLSTIQHDLSRIRIDWSLRLAP